MYRYCAFGLTINSELEFPELLPLPEEPKTFDVTVQAGSIPATGLSNPAQTGLFFQTAPGRFWMNLPDIARFEVESGSLIRYQPTADADEDTIRLYLLGSCFGALLIQRKLLVIHGNGIRFQNQSVIFAGSSGNGKSTLAAAFYQRGFAILSDDLCVINDQYQVVPGYPQLKLWQDTAEKLGFPLNTMRRIRHQVNKFAIKIEAQFCQTPLDLAAIYFLSSHPEKDIAIDHLSGADIFSPLHNNSFRPEYLAGLGMQANHLRLCGSLTSRVPVTRITRPDTGFHLDVLLDTILKDLAKKGVKP